MLYVRTKDSDTWHFCSDCSNYPAGARWQTGTNAEIREVLGKDLTPTKGTGREGSVIRADLIKAAQAMEGSLPVTVRRSKPTDGEFCDECLAKRDAGKAGLSSVEREFAESLEELRDAGTYKP